MHYFCSFVDILFFGGNVGLLCSNVGLFCGHDVVLSSAETPSLFCCGYSIFLWKCRALVQNYRALLWT